MSKPSDHWTAELVRTIQECRAENQDCRFGQLIFHLVASADRKRGELSPEFNMVFHERLFNMRDEELVEALKAYGSTGTL